MNERTIPTPNYGYPTKQKAKMAIVGPKPGVPIGWSSVLCSDGERRAVRFGTASWNDPFLGAGWVHSVFCQVWDYAQNRRIEVSGYLRWTTDNDRLFVQFPLDTEFTFPDWTPEIVAEAHGQIVDGHGHIDDEFTVR